MGLSAVMPLLLLSGLFIRRREIGLKHDDDDDDDAVKFKSYSQN